MDVDVPFLMQFQQKLTSNVEAVKESNPQSTILKLEDMQSDEAYVAETGKIAFYQNMQLMIIKNTMQSIVKKGGCLMNRDAMFAQNIGAEGDLMGIIAKSRFGAIRAIYFNKMKKGNMKPEWSTIEIRKKHLDNYKEGMQDPLLKIAGSICKVS